MPSPQPPSPENKPLGFDEFIAIAIAFTAIGTIFFWSLSKPDSELNANSLLSIATSPDPSVRSEPLTPLQTNQAVSSLPRATKVSPFQLNPAPQVQPLPSIPPVNVVSPPPIIPVIPLTASPVPQPVPAKKAPVKFSDVPSNHWARPFIEGLGDREIVAGFRDGKFKPSQPVTRAELAAILPKVINLPLTQNSMKFQDVKSDYWGATSIEKSVKMGLFKGYPDNNFRPNEPVSRVQVLATLTNALKLKSSTQPANLLAAYQDVKQIPNWAIEQVAVATEAGLVVNYPKRDILKPNEPATRADVAAMIYQTLVKSGKAEAKSSEYIVRPK